MPDKEFLDIIHNHLPLLNTQNDQSLKQITIDLEGFYSYIEQGIHYDSFDVIKAYIHWLINRFEHLKLKNDDITKFLAAISDDLYAINPHPFIRRIKEIKIEDAVFKSYLTDKNNPLLEEAKAYLDALIAQNQAEATKIILSLKGNTDIKLMYDHLFQVVLYETGYLWQIGRIGIANEHYITAFTQFMMSQFYDELFSNEKNNKHLVAAAVGNEIHEIGIRMIADMFEYYGWNTHYLGANIPTEAMISHLKKHPTDIVAFSITMPNHLKRLETVIQAIKAEETLTDLKIIVGGQPFMLDHTLYKKIGADGFAKNIDDAIQLGDDLIAN